MKKPKTSWQLLAEGFLLDQETTILLRWTSSSGQAMRGNKPLHTARLHITGLLGTSDRWYSLQRKSFPDNGLAFHFVFYPSVFVGLQMLLRKTLLQCCPPERALGAAELGLHYAMAVYYSQVFLRGFLRLQYQQGQGQGASPGRRLPPALRFLFYGMHGFMDEVFFTAAFNLLEKPGGPLGGHTSLWSFFMYGSCSLIVERLLVHLGYGRGWGAWRRLPVYILFVYSWEFSWGLGLRTCNACSWDYSHYPLNFMGLVTLMYLPGWVFLSFYQDLLSKVLLRIRFV